MPVCLFAFLGFLFCGFLTHMFSRAQHRIIEVSQIFVGSALAMEMSVKYLKVTISFTKKSVKFSSVFILPQECQLFLGFRQYERKTVKFTARLAWTTIFNKIRQVFSFRSCHLPRLCSSQGQISYKKHWNLKTIHGHRQTLSGGFLVCYDRS